LLSLRGAGADGAECRLETGSTVDLVAVRALPRRIRSPVGVLRASAESDGGGASLLCTLLLSIEERVGDYLNEHPLSTTGDLAKGLNADRGKVAAARSHLTHAREPANDDWAR
jgi:hypothetical protein